MEGTITQDEADEILEWMSSQPEALNELDGLKLGLEGGGRMKGHLGHSPS